MGTIVLLQLSADDALQSILHAPFILVKESIKFHSMLLIVENFSFLYLSVHDAEPEWEELMNGISNENTNIERIWNGRIQKSFVFYTPKNSYLY